MPTATNQIEQDILDFTNKAVHFIDTNTDTNTNTDTDTDTNKDTLDELLVLYNNLCYDTLNNDMSEEIKEFMFSIIYRLIYFTNELTNLNQTAPNYELTYRMIHELNCVYDNGFYQPLLKQLAKNAITDIIHINMKERPLDCWQGLPNLLDYIYHADDDETFFQHIVEIIVTRLLVDSVKTALEMQPSTLAFWLPKEKSKHLGYLTHPISYHLYNSWIKTAGCPESLDRAKTKCLTHYRKLITGLKSHIDLRAQHRSTQQHRSTPQNENTTKSVLATALVTTCEAVQSIVQQFVVPQFIVPQFVGKPKNKYNYYTHLLADLCKENFIIKREEMSQIWDTILYGDMPGLVSAQAQQQSDIEEEDIEEEDIEEEDIEEDDIEEDDIEEDDIEEEDIEEDEQQSDNIEQAQEQSDIEEDEQQQSDEQAEQSDEELVEIAGASAAPASTAPPVNNTGWFSWFF